MGKPASSRTRHRTKPSRVCAIAPSSPPCSTTAYAAKSSAACGPRHAKPANLLHFKLKGKRGKVRFVPAHVLGRRLIEAYPALAGHANVSTTTLRPAQNGAGRQSHVSGQLLRK